MRIRFDCGKLVLYAILMFLSFMSVHAESPKAPDFAFPKTVSKQALADLSLALEKNDAPAVTRDLLNYYVAEQLVDKNSVTTTAALNRIAEVASSTSDNALRGVLYTLQAKIYAAIYGGQRWVYDSRSLPLEPYPADCSEWSGDQFRARICSLVDSALALAPELQRVPLSEYSSVITTGDTSATSRQTYIYYPTLYDFVATQCISVLNSCGRSSALFSWGLLTRHDLYLQAPFPRYDQIATRILDIYASLLRLHTGRPAPLIHTDIERIAFIANRVYMPADAAINAADREWDLLRDLYEEYSTSDYSGDILIAMMTDDMAKKKWLYEAINRNLTSFPAYWRNDCLLNMKADIAAKSVSVSHPTSVQPDAPITFEVKLSNLEKADIYIYDVSSAPLYNSDYEQPGLPAQAPVAVLPVKSSQTGVPFECTVKVDYTFPRKGNYIAIPVVDGKSASRDWYQKIHVSAYTIASSHFDEHHLWVLDAVDGAPVGGAALTLWKRNSRSAATSSNLGLTDTDGMLAYSSNGVVVASKGNDRYAAPKNVYAYDYRPNDVWQTTAVGYPSLPVYHPGDSMEWVAICYEYKGNYTRPLADKEVDVVIRHITGTELSSSKGKTDLFGRVHGSFLIPDDILTGKVFIEVAGSGRVVEFEVSDYKFPTFSVELQPVERDVPAIGDVTLRGKAATYTGFPLVDATVSLDLGVSQWMRWWWRGSRNISFYTASAVTNAEGEFEITVPASVLATSPIPGGVFSATLSVTSIAGETHQASTSFMTGTRYQIQASMPENVNVSAGRVDLHVKVVNYLDSVVPVPVNYSVLRDSTIILSGTLAAGKSDVDLSSVPSGRYDILFSLADKDLASDLKQSVVIYRADDTVTPVPGTLLWSPVSMVNADAAGNARWLYAVDCDTHLLVTIWTSEKILSREWVKAPAGMRHYAFKLPKDVNEAKMTIGAVGHYREASLTVDVRRDVPSPKLKFTIESFRDRLIPGSEETWTFKVTDETGEGKKSAVVLDMYNRAIDAIASTAWRFNPYRDGYGYNFAWDSPALGSMSSSFYALPRKKGAVCPALGLPDFNTYGYGLGNRNYRLGYANSSIRVRGLGAVKMMAKAEMADETEEEALVVADMANASFDSGMTTAGGSAPADDSTGVEQETPFTYRESEVPLAFFAPSLTTDSDGNLTFSFKVPDANTTWGFRAIAYTDKLLSTNFSADVVTSKPVMVQPNLPRFMRAGDEVAVMASVMNATDSVQTISTLVEIFNPVDGSVIDSREHTDTLSPKGNIAVPFMLRAPSDAPFIGYRVKASTACFADGEQALLPILPAVTPVIDTYPFYMSPDSATYSSTLPAVPSGAKVSLQFCENPVWYVVTALPGILDCEASTANEAAASIFSAAVAVGILRDNPSIEKILAEWAASDKSEAMLTSMLDQNADLKTILLSATPWMLDAKSDTERMTRLALLFDRKTVDRTFKANIALLQKLVRPDGGWAWYSQAQESSEWVTENVLMLLGSLYSMGYLPEDKSLRSMMTDAIGFMDKAVGSNYRKYKNGNYATYVLMRDRLKGFVKSAGATEAISATVQTIVRDWKKYDVLRKAQGALILNSHGYPTLAAKLLESLREYSTYTPQKGMWWPSLDNMTVWSIGKIGATSIVLDAFAVVEPGCKDIDRIRQWLILQKEAKDWGTSVTTSSVIASILSTSKSWISAESGAEVKFDGVDVAPSAVEKATGYFRVPVSVDAGVKPELNVARNSDTPTWGAVYYQYTDSMTRVEPAGCDALSVTKHLLLEESTPQGVKTVEPSQLKVGDKVKVQLTIRADRDMDYVTVIDDRPACYEPVEQLPKPIVAEGIYFYRENRDASTRFFITHLPRGTYLLTYDMWVNNAGTFTSGIATVQSQYAPQLSAHSGGTLIRVM